MLRKKTFVIALTALLLTGAAGAVAQPLDCEALANYPGAEPAGYAEQCLDGVVAAPNGLGPVKAPTDTAFAHDIGFVSDNVVSFTLNNFPGQTTTSMSALPIFGYDYDPTGTTLYAIDTTANMFGTFNPGTGAFSAIGTSTPNAGEAWTGMAVDPVTGTVYMSAVACNVSSSLYSVNPATGAATFIGNTTASTCTIAIAMGCDGILYAHDIISDSIFTVNTTNGAHTLLGPTGLAANFAQGMDVDNDDGTIYIFLYSGGGANTFGTVNPANGAVTGLATDNPLGEFEGAIPNTCAPMETDLAITKDCVSDGLTATCDVTVTNNGPADATNVMVVDNIPVELTYTGDDGCSQGTVTPPAPGPNGTWTWDAGTIAFPGGATCSINFDITTPTGGIVNNVMVSADQTDLVPEDNSDAAEIGVSALVIPTLDTIGMIALLVLLAGAAFFVLRRRA